MTLHLKDARGRTLRLAGSPRRIVSLVPSITETLFELGVGGSIVAITDWCIFPEGLDLPRVGGTKNPRVEEIRALKPDLVHMNLEENVRKDGDAIEEFAPVFVSEPKSPLDVVELIRTLGSIHDCDADASEWIARLEEEIAKPPVTEFSFACPIWKNPWMWCGADTYVSALIESLGGRNVMANQDRYPRIDVAALLAMEPDVIFLPDEPFEFAEADARELRSETKARIVGPFPGHLITWHGTRTLKGLRFLRRELEVI